MENFDIRWRQRFANYQKTLAKLNEAVLKIKASFGINTMNQISDDAFLDDIIKEGLIQRFEYTYELA